MGVQHTLHQSSPIRESVGVGYSRMHIHPLERVWFEGVEQHPLRLAKPTDSMHRTCLEEYGPLSSFGLHPRDILGQNWKLPYRRAARMGKLTSATDVGDGNRRRMRRKRRRERKWFPRVRHGVLSFRGPSRTASRACSTSCRSGPGWTRQRAPICPGEGA